MLRKHTPGCPCCCSDVCGNCTDDPSSRTPCAWLVEASGIVPHAVDPCADCDDLNDSFIVDQRYQIGALPVTCTSGPGQCCRYYELPSTICNVNFIVVWAGARLFFCSILDPLGGFNWCNPRGSFTWPIAATCLGLDQAVMVFDLEAGAGCDFSGATIKITSL